MKGIFGKSQNPRCSCMDFLGDHPRYSCTYPSTDLLKEKHPNRGQSWDPKIHQKCFKNRKKDKFQILRRRSNWARNWFLDYSTMSGYKPILSTDKAWMAKRSTQRSTLFSLSPSTKDSHKTKEQPTTKKPKTWLPQTATPHIYIYRHFANVQNTLPLSI